MKKMLTLALVLVAVSLTAEAKMKYLRSFKAAYPSTSIDSCVICHQGEDYSTKNGYGADLAAAGYSFKAIEQQDSDGDGATNLEEITAGTFPGDNSSAPTQKQMLDIQQ